MKQKGGKKTEVRNRACTVKTDISIRISFYTNLWCDRESSAETVHCLVVLPAEVKENSQTTLQLGVHLSGVRVRCMQEQGLDISK